MEHMTEKKQRKPYVKMRVAQVRLVPDEAVLGGCKTTGGGGIGYATNACAYIDDPCSGNATS